MSRNNARMRRAWGNLDNGVTGSGTKERAAASGKCGDKCPVQRMDGGAFAGKNGDDSAAPSAGQSAGPFQDAACLGLAPQPQAQVVCTAVMEGRLPDLLIRQEAVAAQLPAIAFLEPGFETTLDAVAFLQLAFAGWLSAIAFL